MIDYDNLAMRGRSATYRAMRGESGETLEAILDEYGEQLRKELDELTRGTIGQLPEGEPGPGTGSGLGEPGT